MASQVIYSFTVNANLSTFIVGEIVTVEIEDTTKVISVYKDGSLITSGDDFLPSDERDGKFTVSVEPFSYCSGTTLVTYGRRYSVGATHNPFTKGPLKNNWRPSFPYYYTDIDPNSASCTITTPPDMVKFGTPIVKPASTTTAQDGEVTVRVESSSLVKFYTSPFHFNGGGYAHDSVSNSIYTYTFLNLNAGTRNLYASSQNGGMEVWQVTVPLDDLASYGLKYRGWIQGRESGTPNGVTWRVDLKFKDYSDASAEIDFFSGDPLKIEMGNGVLGLNKFEDLICSTRISLGLYSETDSQWISDFSRINDKDVKIEVYKQSTLMYSGFNLAEQYSEPWMDAPYRISVRFSDGLGDLKNYKYIIDRKIKDEFNPSETSIEQQAVTGRSTKLEVLAFCFEKLGLGYGIRSCLNYYSEQMDVGNGDDPLTQAYVNNDIFYNDDNHEPFDCQQVVEMILKSVPNYARVSSDGSYYYITPLEFTKEEDYREFDRYGTYDASGTIDPLISITSADGSGVSFKGTLMMDVTYQQIQLLKKLRIAKSLIPEFSEKTLISGGSGHGDTYEGWTNKLNGDTTSWQPIKKGQDHGVLFNSVDGNGADSYITTKGTIEYQSADKFSLDFTAFFDPKGELTEKQSSPPWVYIRWSLKVGTWYYNQNGSWSETETVNSYFLFQMRSENQIIYIDSFRTGLGQTEESFELRIYDTDVKYHQYLIQQVASTSWANRITNLLPTVKAISTTNLSDGNRIICQLQITDDDNEDHVNYYFTLRHGDYSNDGIQSIVATDNSDFAWVLDANIEVKKAKANDSVYYIKNPSFTLLPNGADLPDTDIVEKRLSDGNVRLSEFDVPIFGVPSGINNAKRLIKNIFWDASGSVVTEWRCYEQLNTLNGDGNYFEFTEDLSGATNASVKFTVSGFTGNRLVFGCSNQIDNDEYFFAARTSTLINVLNNNDVEDNPTSVLVDGVEKLGSTHTQYLALINDGLEHTVEMIGCDFSTYWSSFFINDYFSSTYNPTITYTNIQFDLDGDGKYEYQFNSKGEALLNHAPLTFTGTQSIAKTAVTALDTTENIKLGILARHFKTPLQRINITGFTNAELHGYNVIRHFNDDARKYIIDGLTLSVKNGTISGEIAEITANTLVNSSAFTSDFTNDFLDT